MSKQVEFITYVENNDIEKVKEYLLKIDAKHNDSEALNSACVNGNEEMVEILLPWSDANAKNGFALKNAAYYGHVNIAKMLCDKVDSEYVGDAMCVAAIAGNLDVLKAIKTNRAFDMDSALAYAALNESNDPKSIETLKYLNRNANPNANGARAMINAIESGNKKAIDLFFDRVDIELISEKIKGIETDGVNYFNEKIKAKAYESLREGNNGIVQALKNKEKNNTIISSDKKLTL